MPFKYASMEERLIANSVISEMHFWHGTPCWEWIGAYKKNRSGMSYPTLNVRFQNGLRKGKVKTERAHRVALRVFKGRYLGKRYVGGHACNVSWCINPAHLTGGTQRANIRKCVHEERHDSGWCQSWPNCSCIARGRSDQCPAPY